VTLQYFEDLRDREFSRLDEGGHVYLDYTGSGLYAESQLRETDRFLEHHVRGGLHVERLGGLEARGRVLPVHGGLALHAPA
jgi:hypothetical protein